MNQVIIKVIGLVLCAYKEPSENKSTKYKQKEPSEFLLVFNFLSLFIFLFLSITSTGSSPLCLFVLWYINVWGIVDLSLCA